MPFPAFAFALVCGFSFSADFNTFSAASPAQLKFYVEHHLGRLLGNSDFTQLGEATWEEEMEQIVDFYHAIAQVAVDEAVAVKRVWCVADAGLVINPDGALNQLEGGIVQAISWTLKEQVRFNERGIASLDWEGYPILRFSEVPEIDA